MSNRSQKSAAKYVTLGVALTAATVGLGATLFSLWLRRQQEEVYHESEMMAMDEMDHLTIEDEPMEPQEDDSALFDESDRPSPVDEQE